MRTAVLGAGPAGLGAAYQLTRSGVQTVVIEAAPEVGGLARSVDMWGQPVELGAHLLLREDPRIDALWDQVVGDRYDAVVRSTLLCLGGRWFRYPFEPLDVTRQLGAARSARVLAGALARRPESGDTLEGWIVSRFGRPAFELFFADYARKLLGRPAGEIHRDYAQLLLGFQRAGSAVGLLMSRLRRRSEALVCRPHGGVGRLLGGLADAVQEGGGEVRVQTRVDGIQLFEGRVASLRAGDEHLPVGSVISTLPLPVLARLVGGVSALLDERLARLPTRNVIVVFLLLDGPSRGDAQWRYVGDLDYLVSRITDFSAFVSPGRSRRANGVVAAEMWTQDGSEVWQLSDERCVDRVSRELAELDLLASPVRDSKVIRIGAAMPILDVAARATLDEVTPWLAGVRGLFTTGRFGSFTATGVHESILLGMDTAEAVMAQHEPSKL